jgi:rod shape-determining protein MreB
VKAIGKEAKNLIGKTADCTSILYPVYEGEIVDLRLATLMMKEFFARIGIKSSTLKRAQVLFSVPCGISERAYANYVNLAEEVGIRKAFFVEQPYLSAMASGVAFSESDPVFCLDIGGGVTNIAVLSLGGIIAGLSMNLGGHNMDANIIEKMARQNGLNIGDLTAERIKNEIGSLSSKARASTVAQGSSVETFYPASIAVQSGEIIDCIRVYVDKILEYAGIVLNQLPAEVAAAVNKNGLCLSGGVAKIDGVAEYISRALGMDVHVTDEPQFAVVLGGGMIARDQRLYNAFTKKYAN